MEAVEYKSVNRNRYTICAEDCPGSALSKRALAHDGNDRFDEEKLCDVISVYWQERGQSSGSSPFLSFGTWGAAKFGEEGGIFERRGAHKGHVLV